MSFAESQISVKKQKKDPLSFFKIDKDERNFRFGVPLNSPVNLREE